MMTVFRLVPLIALLQLGNVSPTPVIARGTIEGTVQRAGTHEPIDDVRVVLIDNGPVDFSDPTKATTTPSTSTDAQGKFSLKNVAPGAYRLTLSANGYVRQEYGQRTFPGRGTQINLAAGQAMKDLAIEMTPAGSVSGTIRDSERRPIAGVPVQLMRDSYDQAGERRLRPNGSVTRTDDHGEFRIYFVTPGRYYLNAGTPNGPPGNGDQRPLANEVPDTFAFTYFPGVLALKDATPIDIQPGTTKVGVDFTVSRVRGVRVRGRVIDATTVQPPENPKIKLAYRDPGVPWDYDLDYMGRGKVSYKNGDFEFRDVLPGQFGVSASMDVPGQPAVPQGKTPLQRIGYLPVEVGGSDVEGIVVVLSPTTSISGRVRVDGRSDMMDAFPGIDAKPGVELEPASNGVIPSTPGVPHPTYGALNPDGTFRIDNVIPGEYRIQLNLLRASYYFKEVRLGGSDVLNVPFQYTGHEQGDLEIVVSPNVASVDGVIAGNGLTTVSGAQVVLVPDKARHRFELFKTATTDKDGHFRIANIAPGDYKLYAWEAIEPYRWFDMEFVKADELLASPVHLGESSRQTINARLIPAR